MTLESWKFINTFAPWLSALGTISAVIVSLYLARRKDEPRLKINTNIRNLISDDIEGNQKYLFIEIINIGMRPVKINAVGWTIGLIKKQSFIQLLGKDQSDSVSMSYSSDFPVTLKDGEEARWLYSLEKKNNWIDSFKKNLSWCPRWDLYNMKIEVFTNHGIKHKAKIGKSLKNAFLDHRD